MESYRDLDIYHEAKRLAVQIHALSLTLPKFELYEEGSQIRRSSKAITSMIVEGVARRRYKADYIKYLIYAIGECDESILHLDFLYETQSLKDKAAYESLRASVVILSMRINRFTQWVEDNYVWKPGNKLILKVKSKRSRDQAP
jgi:four helix bundle protein